MMTTMLGFGFVCAALGVTSLAVTKIYTASAPRISRRMLVPKFIFFLFYLPRIFFKQLAWPVQLDCKDT